LLVRAERYHGLPYPTLALLMAGLLIGWWRWRPFRVEVEGSSMSPSLEPGDWVLAVRTRRIRVGDVVVAEHPERPGFEVVKRVAAGPGQRVGEGLLGPAEYWLLGDHEQASSDSRTVGPFDVGAIRGVVVLRYWPNLMRTRTHRTT
jgi:nickel-type superoxide dismutase maturation protease